MTIKRLFILIANWILIISAPLWAGFLFWIYFIKDAYEHDLNERDVVLGKEFIFKDMF